MAKVAPNSVDVVFSFDTTGSMRTAIRRVKEEVVETVRKMFSEIDNLRIGIIAHGDYCDGDDVIRILDLTTNERKIIQFINDAPDTCGGDAEECYELVLNKATDLNWAAGKRALILIGDDVPHGPHDPQNKGRIDWRSELKSLAGDYVRVYGVQALGRSHATAFYREIAELTGGFHLNLEQFDDVVDTLMAICYQQSGKIDQFEAEVSKAGRMSPSMSRTFDRLTRRGTKAKTENARAKKLGLKPVHPSRFQILKVKRDCDIKSFVEKNGLDFQLGRGFYEFTKSVMVQKGKEVIIQDKYTGDMFTGNDARNMIGIPIGVDAQVSPKDLHQFRAFIQSTSVNRKLLKGTSFLYELDGSLK